MLRIKQLVISNQKLVLKLVPNSYFLVSATERSPSEPKTIPGFC